MLRLLQHLHPLNFLNITRQTLKGCLVMKEELEKSRNNNRPKSAIVMVKDWNNDNIYVAFIRYIWYCLFSVLPVRCIDKIHI